MMRLPSAERLSAACFEDQSARGGQSEVPPGTVDVAEAKGVLRVTAVSQRSRQQ